jgi:hypothetical protein
VTQSNTHRNPKTTPAQGDEERQRVTQLWGKLHTAEFHDMTRHDMCTSLYYWSKDMKKDERCDRKGPLGRPRCKWSNVKT